MSIPILRNLSGSGPFSEGTFAARPNTATEGVYYFVPALSGGGSALFRWTSGAWVVVSQATPRASALPTSDLFFGREIDLTVGEGGSGFPAWRFAYEPNHGDAYKWQFVGGSPIVTYINPGDIFSSTFAVVPNDPQITLANPGIYDVAIQQRGFNNSAGNSTQRDMRIYANEVAAGNVMSQAHGNLVGEGGSVMHMDRLTFAGRDTRIRIYYQDYVARSTSYDVRKIITPVRIAT